MNSGTEMKSPLNLGSHPAYHKKLLEIITEIETALSKDSRIRFYVTGGAAVEYTLQDGRPLINTLTEKKKKPILDIDCVCVIDPTLSAKDHDIVREEAMGITSEILKKHLEGTMLKNLMKETPTLEIVEIGFNNDLGGPAEGPAIMIPSGSPLTGLYYYDRKRKLYVISVRLRTGVIQRDQQSLLDISFPAFDYPRLKEKWEESKSIRSIPVSFFNRNTPILIPTLYPEKLILDQKYAAEAFGVAENKRTRRLNRVNRLSKFAPLLPTVKARIVPTVTPSRIATGGAGINTNPSVTSFMIQKVAPGVIVLNEFRNGTYWNTWEAIAYDKRTGIYTFRNGMRGRL